MKLQAVVSMAVLISACTDAGAPAAPVVERVDSAGIEIVRAGGTDVPLPWTVSESVVVDPDQAGSQVLDVSLVTTDDQGRIYALDAGSSRIVVFDADGRFVREQGGKGGGPGEAAMPVGVVVSADGTAAMFDIGKRGLVRFGPDGSVIEERKLHGFFGGRLATDGDAVLFDRQQPDASGAPTTRVTLVRGTDTIDVATRPRAETRQITLKSCGMGFSGMPPIFEPTLRWTTRGGRVAIAEDVDYDIRVLENDREVRRVRRDVAPRAATAELAARELGDGMQVRTEGGIRKCDGAEVVEQRGFGPHIAAVGDLILSPSGELWVKRGGVKGEATPIDVFAADGAYVGTLPAGTPFPTGFLPGDRYIGIETDDFDVRQIVIYQLHRENT